MGARAGGGAEQLAARWSGRRVRSAAPRAGLPRWFSRWRLRDAQGRAGGPAPGIPRFCHRNPAEPGSCSQRGCLLRAQRVSGELVEHFPPVPHKKTFIRKQDRSQQGPAGSFPCFLCPRVAWGTPLVVFE